MIGCVLMTRYVSALADLAAPKAALPLLADERRLAAYEAAIAAALCEQPGANSLYHSSEDAQSFSLCIGAAE